MGGGLLCDTVTTLQHGSLRGHHRDPHVPTTPVRLDGTLQGQGWPSRCLQRLHHAALLA